MAIWYTDPTATGANNGTSETNAFTSWPTTYTAGDTYLGKGGETDATLGTTTLIVSADNVTFGSYGTGQFTLDGVSITASNKTIRVQSDNFTIDNMHIKSAKRAVVATQNICLQLDEDTSGHVIKNCKFTGQATVADGSRSDNLYMYCDYPFTVDNCEFVGWNTAITHKPGDRPATAPTPSTACSITNNYIHSGDGPDSSEEGSSDGIHIGATGSTNNVDWDYNLLISGNRISDYRENAIDCVGGRKIIIEYNDIGAPWTAGKNPALNFGVSAFKDSANDDDKTGAGTIIRNNYIHDIDGISGTTAFVGIAMGGSCGQQIYNNIFVDCGKSIFSSSVDDNVKIYNNTFVRDSGGPGTSVIIRFTLGDNIEVRNNIFLDCAATYQIHMASGLVCTHGTNLYTKALNTSGDSLVYAGGSIESANPELDKDYKPSDMSPAVGAGVRPLSQLDYNGDTSQTEGLWDIGAVWYDVIEQDNSEPDLYTFGGIASTSFDATQYARIALQELDATVRVHATADCWIKFGGSTVTVDGTTGMAFARGSEVFTQPDGATHVAVRGATGIGAINFTTVSNTELPDALGDTVQLAYSHISNSVAIPDHSGTIRVYTPTDCYIAFGTTSSIATGTYFEAGTEILEVPRNATHIAMVQYSIAATAYITGVN